MKREKGNLCHGYSFTDVRAKSPNISPMDFWSFGRLKASFSNVKLQPFVDFENLSRAKIPISKLEKALMSWKLWWKKVVKIKCYNIRQLKHKHFVQSSFWSTIKLSENVQTLFILFICLHLVWFFFTLYVYILDNTG